MSCKIPELIEISMIAKVIGWGNKKTVKFLRDEGLALDRPSKRGNPWRVTRAAFAVTFPTIYGMLVAAYEAGELASKRGGDRRGSVGKECQRMPKVAENAIEPGSI